MALPPARSRPLLKAGWTSSGAKGWDASKHPRGYHGYFSVSGSACKGGVSVIQEKLGMVPTGNFDQQTHQKVQAYQKSHHLQEDGIVGSQTAASLLGKPPQPPGQLQKDQRNTLCGDKTKKPKGNPKGRKGAGRTRSSAGRSHGGTRRRAAARTRAPARQRAVRTRARTAPAPVTVNSPAAAALQQKIDNARAQRDQARQQRDNARAQRDAARAAAQRKRKNRASGGPAQNQGVKKEDVVKDGWKEELHPRGFHGRWVAKLQDMKTGDKFHFRQGSYVGLVHKTHDGKFSLSYSTYGQRTDPGGTHSLHEMADILAGQGHNPAQARFEAAATPSPGARMRGGLPNAHAAARAREQSAHDRHQPSSGHFNPYGGTVRTPPDPMAGRQIGESRMRGNPPSSVDEVAQNHAVERLGNRHPTGLEVKPQQDGSMHVTAFGPMPATPGSREGGGKTPVAEYVIAPDGSVQRGKADEPHYEKMTDDQLIAIMEDPNASGEAGHYAMTVYEQRHGHYYEPPL